MLWAPRHERHVGKGFGVSRGRHWRLRLAVCLRIIKCWWRLIRGTGGWKMGGLWWLQQEPREVMGEMDCRR